MSSQVLRKVALLPGTGAFKKRFSDQLLALEKAFPRLGSKSSAEQIHQARILTRRSRASLGVISQMFQYPRIKECESTLKKMTRALGPARSLDVALRDLHGLLPQESKWDPHPLAFLRKGLKKKRDRAREEMKIPKKASGKLKKFRKFFGRDLHLELRSREFLKVLSESSEDLFRNLTAKWEIFEETGKVLDLHQIRIALKKWRYILEIKEECLGFPSKEFLVEVKSIQDRLGHIHDLEVLRGYLLRPKFGKKAQAKMRKKEYNFLLKDLKVQISKEVQSFHEEGADLLLPLMKRVYA